MCKHLGTYAHEGQYALDATRTQFVKSRCHVCLPNIPGPDCSISDISTSLSIKAHIEQVICMNVVGLSNSSAYNFGAMYAYKMDQVC